MASSVQKYTLELPALYADHHVVEVRRILFELPGVSDIYASSAFHLVEVTYDPDKTSPDAILACLDSAGYLGELEIPVESGASEEVDSGKVFYRHSAVYEQTRSAVSFGQVVSYLGRPLWTCPGMGVIKKMEE